MDADALGALMLQLEWGADEALADAPASKLTAPRGAPARTGLPPPAAEAVRPVASSAPAPVSGAAGSLEELCEQIRAYEGCALRDTATGPVLPEGDPGKGLLVIYGPPLADDDRVGRPLRGAAGAYFDAMLASIGLDRAQILLAPLIPWRPPGERPPSPQELAQCLPFLHRLITLADPRLLVLLGMQPARALGGPDRRRRGDIAPLAIPGGAAAVPALVTADPAELLRLPDRRPSAWADLRRLARFLAGQTR